MDVVAQMATIWGLRWPRAGSGAPANKDLNRKPPFGCPAGQGLVLVPLQIRTLIERPPFGGPDGQGPVLVLLLITTLIERHHLGAQMAKGRFWCLCE